MKGKKNENGKKYYNNGKVEFEGEYLYDNKWNGNGYNIKWKIIYQLINGRGNIKEYNNDGELEFKGEYLNGEIKGKGKEYNYDRKYVRIWRWIFKWRKEGKEKEYYNSFISKIREIKFLIFIFHFNRSITINI